MVNVGGRSKGCTTCRKRRIKCDEEHPTCLRCRKSGLECDGPIKEATFIVGKIIKSRRSSKGTDKDSDRGSPPCQGVDKSRRSSKGSSKGSDQELSPCPSDLPRVSLLGSSEFETYLCYALKHLRHGGTIELTTRTIKSTDIVPAPTMAATHYGQISHRAVLSFAAIFFGSQHRQAEITRMGFTMYGKVLQRLNGALSDPAQNTTDDLIHAVVTLTILELFACTGAGNYLKHMAGLERLFALRDLSLPVSYESADMYRSLRQMIIFAALRSKKASILARPEWKKHLREKIGSPARLQKQELFDVLADCTVILSARERILGSFDMAPEISAYELDRLKQDALNLLAQLSSWKGAWDSDSEHKLTEIPISHGQLETRTDLIEGCLPFTTILEFPSESVAIMMALYNIALIHVLQLLTLLTSVPDRQSYNSTATSQSKPQLQSQPQSNENFLHYPPHLPNLWPHPANILNHPPNPYLAAQEAPIIDVCRSISYHLATHQRRSSSTFHWATATVWIKVGGEESVAGRYVWKLLVESQPMLVKTLRTLAA
ncbi:hypothetical protein VTL71DRAFT_11920 [Oculimacula yallundae]|uniref:Zn(2)-C6 fungal-type domain-containing protein n=1 Tax=Oculimacula yallundae TaxID=86028 RepID=A0ABR4CS30_9HELO